MKREDKLDLLFVFVVLVFLFSWLFILPVIGFINLVKLFIPA